MPFVSLPHINIRTRRDASVSLLFIIMNHTEEKQHVYCANSFVSSINTAVFSAYTLKTSKVLLFFCQWVESVSRWFVNKTNHWEVYRFKRKKTLQNFWMAKKWGLRQATQRDNRSEYFCEWKRLDKNACATCWINKEPF